MQNSDFLGSEVLGDCHVFRQGLSGVAGDSRPDAVAAFLVSPETTVQAAPYPLDGEAPNSV